jgi:hypothetical protein
MAAEGPGEPAQPTVETHPPGERPLTETAAAPTEQPEAPSQEGLPLEVADAPKTGSPILDVLEASGYKVVEEGAASPSGEKRPKTER